LYLTETYSSYQYSCRKFWAMKMGFPCLQHNMLEVVHLLFCWECGWIQVVTSTSLSQIQMTTFWGSYYKLLVFSEVHETLSFDPAAFTFFDFPKALLSWPINFYVLMCLVGHLDIHWTVSRHSNDTSTYINVNTIIPLQSWFFSYVKCVESKVYQINI